MGSGETGANPENVSIELLKHILRIEHPVHSLLSKKQPERD